MLNESRIGVYNYLYGLFYESVTKNVYSMSEPQELTNSDTTDGFIVIRVGNINDASEFSCETYGLVRVYIEAYIPTKTRGRLDKQRYEYFENAISRIIKEERDTRKDSIYSIQDGSTISLDELEVANANNVFHMFVRSFVVMIDE